MPHASLTGRFPLRPLRSYTDSGLARDISRRLHLTFSVGRVNRRRQGVEHLSKAAFALASIRFEIDGTAFAKLLPYLINAPQSVLNECSGVEFNVGFSNRE